MLSILPIFFLVNCFKVTCRPCAVCTAANCCYYHGNNSIWCWSLSCYYWCWCSMLGDLIIPVDSLSISLGMGLSITLKAGVEQLRCMWGAVAQWSRAPVAKAGDPGLIPGSCPEFFFSSWLTDVDGIWRISGALVQFGCYQHRCEWKRSMVL